VRDDQELRDRAAELASVYWHHSIRLFPDLVTNGGKSEALLDTECEAILGPLDLEGREVLDIGSWNGYYAFEAKRAGAARVIASDSLCWNLPALRGRETFELARECLDLDVEAKVIDPTELPGDLAAVDVVLLLGVFYHMHDPIPVLKNAASLARQALVIETHQDLLDIGRAGMAFYPRDTLNGDHSNWWGPNPECMFELLESIGRPQVFYQHHPVIGPTRGIYHAYRTADVASQSFTATVDNSSVFNLRSPEGRTAVFRPSRVRPTPMARGRAAAARRWRALRGRTSG